MGSFHCTVLLAIGFIGVARCLEAPCEIDLNCEECLPDNMPAVTSHRAINGKIIIPSGDRVSFLCHKTKLLLYPEKNTIQAYCEDNSYRVLVDTTLKHLMDLGCQANFYDDMMHSVEHCDRPLQGRSYQFQDADSLVTRHLADVCFDQDVARPVFAHMTFESQNTMQKPQHSDQEQASLGLFGNLNRMFDKGTTLEADKLYSDERKLNKRLQELLKHKKFNFANQDLVAASLLCGRYYADQNGRIAQFASNKIALWKSIAQGNYDHIQRDVVSAALLLGPTKSLDVYIGTHKTLSLRTDKGPQEIFLKSGNRFPIPKYVWTVIHNKKTHKAVAITVVNNPYLAISDIRETIFCTSVCGKLAWLDRLKAGDNYETPLYGLVFCCNIHDFNRVVTEMPRIFADIPAGETGLLKNL